MDSDSSFCNQDSKIIRTYIKQTSVECLLSVTPKIWLLFWFLFDSLQSLFTRISFNHHNDSNEVVWSCTVLSPLHMRKLRFRKLRACPRSYNQLNIRSSKSKALAFSFIHKWSTQESLLLCPNNIENHGIFWSSWIYASYSNNSITCEVHMKSKRLLMLLKISIFKNHPFCQGRLNPKQQLTKLTRKKVRLGTRKSCTNVEISCLWNNQ